MSHNIALSTAFAAALSLGVMADAEAAEKRVKKEKCYGVAKAGKNDCATKNSSCAGTATTDNQSDAFVVLPKGLCDKLAGGSKQSS